MNKLNTLLSILFLATSMFAQVNLKSTESANFLRDGKAQNIKRYVDSDSFINNSSDGVFARELPIKNYGLTNIASGNVWPDTVITKCEEYPNSSTPTTKIWSKIVNGKIEWDILKNWGIWTGAYTIEKNYTYNSQGDITHQTNSLFSDSLISLVQQIEYFHYYSWNIDSSKVFRLDTNTNQLSLEEYIYKYKYSNKDSVVHHYSGSPWKDFKITYRTGSQVDSIIMVSDSVLSPASAKSKQIYFYNNNILSTLYIQPGFPQDSIVVFYSNSNAIDSTESWKLTNNVWIKNTKRLYTYVLGTIKIEVFNSSNDLIAVNLNYNNSIYSEPKDLSRIESFTISGLDSTLWYISSDCYNSISSNLPDYVPAIGLKVWYPLDTLGILTASTDGITTIGRDLSGQKLHWNAGSSYIPKTNRFGVPGGAMSYTQNVAQTPYSGVLGTESRSVSVWIKHKGYSSDPVFFQYGSQLAGKRFSGHVNYNCNGVGVGSAFSTTTNNQALDTNWHHIVYVLDTSQCSGNCSVTDVDVYVDGVMYPNCNVFNGSTAINTLGTFDLQFIFGNSTVADSNRLALDDFGMWNRPLTQDEILDLYSGSTGPKAVADLQACYYSDDIVSLSWTAPADTGGDFLGFVVYRADSLNDSFRVVDTLFDYVSTYLDTTPYIPANYTVSCAKEPYRYFIKTLDGFGRESSVTDTVRNVVLEYFDFTGLWGIEGPAWSKTHSDSLPREFLVYETQHWANNWTVVDTANKFQASGCVYMDTVEDFIYNCAGEYTKYKVEYGNGCFSNIDSVYREDVYSPYQYDKIKTSFTPQNQLTVLFDESQDSLDVYSYILYYKDTLSSNPLDSIERQAYLNNGWTVQIDSNLIANKVSFYVVPIDSCGNYDNMINSWWNISKPIYLNLDFNAGDFQLDWNSREVDSGNVFYTIYEAKYDGAGPGSYSLISNTIDTSADMSLSDSYENYCFYVSATSSTSNFVMESNRVCVSFVGIDENHFSYNLHPNPSNGDFLIHINSGNAGDYEMELLNHIGQVVHRATLVNGDNHVTLDQQLAKGSYILVLKDENSQAVKREVLILQ